MILVRSRYPSELSGIEVPACQQQTNRIAMLMLVPNSAVDMLVPISAVDTSVPISAVDTLVPISAVDTSTHQ